MNDIYSRYRLESTSFDSSLFESEWGGRLKTAGFEDTFNAIRNEAQSREFLRNNLTAEQRNKIDEKEGIAAAKEAETFQSRIAKTAIQESREKIVDLRLVGDGDDLKWTFTSATYHEACGEWAGKPKLFYVRESVATRIINLAQSFAALGDRLHFEDGFRPTGVQEGLFRRRVVMARDSHPDWSEEELILEARSKTAYTPRFAAHKAGAAVDLRVISGVTKRAYDIGHEYPDGGEIVRLNTPYVTQEQWQNRKVLEHLARRCGLLMYPFEDWHVCYGDATAAAVARPEGPYIAQYGPVKKFDPLTGHILDVYSEDELDQVFSWKS